MSSGIPMPNIRAPWIRGDKLKSITLRLSLPALIVAGAVLWHPEALRLYADATGGRAPQFSSSVNLVEVYASVVDGAGQPARGLTVDDFEVLEDGAVQRISTFTAGDFPLTVALAIDRSFSMAGQPLATIKAATRSFLEALRPEDKAVVIAIGSEVTVIGQPGAARAGQVAAVQGLTAWGTTSLHDAIIAAIESVDGATGRRALVIMSDGDDRYSDASAAETISRARRSNVMVYPIALGKIRPALFAELSTLTGGRSFHARDLAGLNGMLSAIAHQLREQYLLGYSPARTPVNGANEWRSISVHVKTRGLSVRARDGYFVR
jgi:Ca-activated chloride channel family protein